MVDPLVKRCTGNGLSSCTRCRRLGRYSLMWDSFLFQIDGIEGRYCSDCVKAILLDLRQASD